MYEHLSERMQHVIREASVIAREYEQDFVGTEHILLAILREGTGLGAKILNAMKIDEYAAKMVIDRLAKKSMEDTWVFGRLPGTPHFRNVIATAIEEARQLEAKRICTEHLLLALLRERGSVAQAALEEMGVTVGKVRHELTRLLAGAADDAQKRKSP